PLRADMESLSFAKLMKTTRGILLLDRFIKESIRLTLMEATSVCRRVLKDFVISHRTCVREGNWISIPPKVVQDDAQLFPNPRVFNEYCFVNLEKYLAVTRM
ncbi:hypothetical protein K469DRAFT_556165, partial [Zopfia rhizophila CBS 207.26]